MSPRTMFWVIIVLLNAAMLADSTSSTSVWTFCSFFALALGVCALIFGPEDHAK